MSANGSRAVVWRSGSFVVESRPIPEPGPGDALVRLEACGLCGTDLHLLASTSSFSSSCEPSSPP
jgi:threonine dehydrogenase-like Zn-dependent dehydrogenase